MQFNQANVNAKEDLEAIHKELPLSFAFTPKDPTHTERLCSVYDSAYNSLVCSPFSPVIQSLSRKTVSPTNQERDSEIRDSMSPFLESNENDEVFNVSLEHISDHEILPPSNIHQRSSVMDSAIFRPITKGGNNDRMKSSDKDTASSIQLRSNYRRNTMSTQRSISTQTKFSMSSSMMYRPNSAPLQEGVEEELDSINIDGTDNGITDGIHRNYTCHCIRSPMPDLIQPIFQYNNTILGNKLSLIADQFDERINPLLD